MITNEDKIREAGEKVWPGCTVTIGERRITYTLPRYSDVNHIKFQDLNKLSDLLDTDQIDLERGEHFSGFAYSSWTYEGSYDNPPSVIVYRVTGECF